MQSCVEIPAGTSGITLRHDDDFESRKDFIELCTIEVDCDSAAFWFVMSTFTHERHWNHCFFEVTSLSDELCRMSDFSDEDTTSLNSVKQENHRDSFRLHDKQARLPPPRGWRYSALRELSRKTPAPIGGGTDGNDPTFSAREWVTHYVKYGSSTTESDVHSSVYGLYIPQCACPPHNPRALRYWPFQYPKVKCYKYTFEENACNALEHEAPSASNGEVVQNTRRCSRSLLRYSVVPLGDITTDDRQYEDIERHARKAAERALIQVKKRAERFDSSKGVSTYVKRVIYDRLVPERLYREHYNRLKVKYSYWVDIWTECTDPVKFVFEEMSIAAYLIALWEIERKAAITSAKQSFIDCGCGNGFLVYLLRSEGYRGIGMDLQKRAIWDQYPPDISECLLCKPVDPSTYDCGRYDWIIGNHSDELTPWIPVLAAKAQKSMNCTQFEVQKENKSGKQMTPAKPRIFIIPCCFFDFDGRKLAFDNTRRTIRVPNQQCNGKYEQYVQWIAHIAAAFGFHTEMENLRIPSTKYRCIIGRYIEFEERTKSAVIEEMIKLMCLDAKLSHT